MASFNEPGIVWNSYSRKFRRHILFFHSNDSPCCDHIHKHVSEIWTALLTFHPFVNYPILLAYELQQLAVLYR